MALIRCPNCDTLHDLDDAFLATGRRKVRCASCREIFEAEETESAAEATLAMLPPEPKSIEPAASAEAEDAAFAPEPSPEAEDVFAAADAAEAPANPDADISAEELEALFGDSAPPAAAEAGAEADPVAAKDDTAESAEEHPEFDPQSLARAQDAAVAAGQDTGATGERRARRGAGTMRKAPPQNNRLARTGMMAAMVMAAGLGTASVLVMLREDAVRLFPATARVFDMVGLSASTRGLDIVDVQSQLVTDNGQEMLEVSGRVVNNAKRPIKVPVLRLAIRGGSGAELYVWTANADVPELAPGAAVRFSRRLASPPPDSQSVMVRFVAKDDIVAAIR